MASIRGHPRTPWRSHWCHQRTGCDGRYATLLHGDYIDVEDTAVATVIFENGALGALGVLQAASTFTPDLGFRSAANGTSGAAASIWETRESHQGINSGWL